MTIKVYAIFGESLFVMSDMRLKRKGVLCRIYSVIYRGGRNVESRSGVSTGTS